MQQAYNRSLAWFPNKNSPCKAEHLVSSLDPLYSGQVALLEALTEAFVQLH